MATLSGDRRFVGSVQPSGSFSNATAGVTGNIASDGIRRRIEDVCQKSQWQVI